MYKAISSDLPKLLTFVNQRTIDNTNALEFVNALKSIDKQIMQHLYKYEALLDEVKYLRAVVDKQKN